jgi:hypothetical protein
MLRYRLEGLFSTTVLHGQAGRGGGGGGLEEESSGDWLRGGELDKLADPGGKRGAAAAGREMAGVRGWVEA